MVLKKWISVGKLLEILGVDENISVEEFKEKLEEFVSKR